MNPEKNNEIDSKITLQQLKDLVEEFVQERDWEQFHSAKNLSMKIAIEAAELMEIFAWVQTPDELKNKLTQRQQDIQDEIADILITLLALANRLNISLYMIFQKKLAKTKEKYPVLLAKGRSDKYTTYK